MSEFSPYTIAVPHQRPAYTVAGALSEDESRDLHGRHFVPTSHDEDRLLAQCDPRDTTARHPHQWVRIRTIILEQRLDRARDARPLDYLAVAIAAYRLDPSPETLAEILHELTRPWTDEEKEDGGQVQDHLSDLGRMSREEIAAIPADWWPAAWAHLTEVYG